MFWAITLPFLITSGIFLVAAIYATVLAKKHGKSIKWVIFLGPLLMMLGFVPSCMTVQAVIDPFRFGIFTYADFDAVNDWRIEKYLPPQAVDLTILKEINGYKAKFSIPKKTLDTWFKEWSLKHKDSYSEYPGKVGQVRFYDEDYFTKMFDEIEGVFSSDMLEYAGPRAPTAAGFTIWYDPETSTAYQETADW